MVEGRSSVSVACGFSEGLPVGLQVIGNFFDEARVLQVASAYEAASGIRNQLAELQARSLGARDRTEPWRSCEPG